MSQPAPHVIPYCPRPLQWRFHEERTRFCVLLCHRRFGKTVAAVNDLVRQALRVGRHDWRAAYAAPFLGQAKAVAWDYCKQFAGAVPGTRFLESELVCVLPTGGRIRLLGTENAQALRGLYLDDLVLDEPADIPREVWTQVLRPMLADRQGRALFCGTPQGTDNLLYDVWQQAGADEEGIWSRFRFTEAFAPDETQSLSICMEEADQADGPWAAVSGASVTVPNPVESPGLGLGARPYLRFLPQGVRKSWLRLTFAVTPVDGKTVSKGRIFAALTREEDLPYEPAIMAG